MGDREFRPSTRASFTCHPTAAENQAGYDKLEPCLRQLEELSVIIDATWDAVQHELTITYDLGNDKERQPMEKRLSVTSPVTMQWLVRIAIKLHGLGVIHGFDQDSATSMTMTIWQKLTSTLSGDGNTKREREDRIEAKLAFQLRAVEGGFTGGKKVDELTESRSDHASS